MTHCERILQALQDGEWKTTSALYRDVGPCILHSRISDLRRKGHTVQGRHVPGRSGPDGYEYRLVVEDPEVRRPHPPPPVEAAEQLTLTATPFRMPELEDSEHGFYG